MTPNNLPGDDVAKLTTDDAIEFFKKRASNPCPACGHSDWNVFVNHAPNHPEVGIGLLNVNVSGAGIHMQGHPVILVTCMKCGFLRLHNLRFVAAWRAEGKPEFKQNG